MFDQNKFCNLCRKHGVEPKITASEIILICAKLPSSKVQKEIIDMIPGNLTPRFMLGPKSSTLATCQSYIRAAGAPVALMKFQDHHITIEIPGNAEVNMEAPIWDQLQTVLKSDPYLKTWKVMACGKIIIDYNRPIMEEFEKNSSIREDPIRDDDILNLKIDLEGDVLDVISRL